MREGMDALKRMAQMAKNRLRNKVNENENKMIKKRGGFIIFQTGSMDIKSRIITKEDDKLYQKVVSILDEGEVFNPLARLIDSKLYSKLDEPAKERYLFDLVDKYKRYKEKYEREQSVS